MVRTRAARLALVSILAVIASMFFANTAEAKSKTASPPLEQQAWFWTSNQDVTSCAGAQCVYASVGQGPLNADGGVTTPIAPGHLGVAMKKGISDMRAYLQFDLSDIPEGSTIDSFIITLTTSRPNDAQHVKEHADAQTSAPATTGPTGAKIDACPMAEPWGPAEGDAPVAKSIDPNTGEETDQQNEPTKVACDKVKITGKEGDTTWSFDLTDMARLWMDPSGEFFNNGITIFPHLPPGLGDTWTVEFHGAPAQSSDQPPKVYVTPAEAVKTSLKYTPPAILPPPPPPPPTKIGGGGVSFGNTPTSVPSAAPSAEPSTAPPPAPVAVKEKQPSTPGYVWLVLPLGLLGMVGLRRAMSDEEEAAVAENRVATALRRRREQSNGAEPTQEGETE